MISDDLVNRIMDYEEGKLDTEGVIALFQELVDTGLAWQLQGSYGRVAAALLEQGFITKGAKNVDDQAKAREEDSGDSGPEAR